MAKDEPIILTTASGRLRSERMRMGLSLAEMAGIGGIDRTSLGKWEKSTADTESMVAFAKWHRAGIDCLFVITGETMPEILANTTAHEAVAILPTGERQELLIGLLRTEFERAKGPARSVGE